MACSSTRLNGRQSFIYVEREREREKERERDPAVCLLIEGGVDGDLK
jgi:hypothetical protein